MFPQIDKVIGYFENEILIITMIVILISGLIFFTSKADFLTKPNEHKSSSVLEIMSNIKGITIINEDGTEESYIFDFISNIKLKTEELYYNKDKSKMLIIHKKRD